MKLFSVMTHLGVEYTKAASAAKAISNVRWRMFGRDRRGVIYAENWTAVEVVY